MALIAIASAQTNNATIVGDVTDPGGSRIAAAAIKVTNSATGVVRELTTNELGSYRVFPLNPGTYEVSVSAPGFSTQVQQNIIVDAAANVKVDFKLDVGVVSEKVEVEATATVLQTQDASVGGTVTGNEVARLPVNGRNYTRLILLMPGTSDQGGSQSNGTFSGTQLISVNGQRRQDNNFTVDGVDNNFMMMNSPGMSPSMDAIQEFRVLDNTSAEFGRSSGSNVNIVIKSGTRNLHGSAYEYLRNDKFDANDFFANKQNTGKVPFRQNQYGVALGGPVIIPKAVSRAREDILVLQLGRLSRAPRSNQHQQFPDGCRAQRRLHRVIEDAVRPVHRGRGTEWLDYPATVRGQYHSGRPHQPGHEVLARYDDPAAHPAGAD